MTFRPGPARWLLPLLAVALWASGCSQAAPAPLPDGVSVSVHQNRPDTEDRRLQLSVTNQSDEAITITSIAFSSPRFESAAPYPKAPTSIGPGSTIDMPVLLPAPVCGSEAPGAAVVELTFELADGRRGSAVIVPEDPLAQLAGISERDCLGAEIAQVAAVSAPVQLRVETIGGRPVALIDVSITPTGRTGQFTIDSVDDTVLFGLHGDETDAPLDSMTLGITVDGHDGDSSFTIPLVPARCDAHAVAEDKRGTLLPLRVTTERAAGLWYLAMGDTVKGQLYDYLNDACAQR